MAFRHQHSLHLTQDLMRVVTELEYMRQQHQIDAIRLDREKIRSPTHLAPLFGRYAEPERHAVGAQEIVLRKTDLHGVVTKNVGYGPVKMILFPLQQILAQTG